MSRHEEEYEYEDDYGREDKGSAGKTLKGYKVVIALMAVVLVAMSGLWVFQSYRQRQEYNVERDTLMNRYRAVQGEMAGLETTNVALHDSIAVQIGRTDSVMNALAKERSITRATIRKYEKELGTLRTVMAGYIYTIDSLGKLNRRLIDENVGMRREITNERLRADMAEERAADADIKIRQGSRVIARGIRLVLLNNNDREVTRASRAARVRVDFTLSANNLTNPGVRAVYTRITGPDGYVLANPSAATFDYEGDPTVYSAVRDDVDYQNSDLDISIFYKGEGGRITAGNYRIEIFMDGLSVGMTETLLR